MARIERRIKVANALNDYKMVKCQVASIDLEIDEIKSDPIIIGGVDYSYKGGCTNKINSSVENNVISMDKIKDRILKLEHEKKTKLNFIKRVDMALSLLEEEDFMLIEMRYFNKHSWYDVAERLALSESACVKRLEKILDRMSNILN